MVILFNLLIAVMSNTFNEVQVGVLVSNRVLSKTSRYVFICMVVLLNLLIAVMSKTFYEVQLSVRLSNRVA